jgi:integrase/recombinase XerD
MTGWPDASFALLKHYVDQLDYCGPRSRRPCASVLRCFQRFVIARSPTPALSRGVIKAWLRAGDAVSPRSLVIRRAQIVDTFLDWLVARGHLHANPFAELRATCRPRGTRSIVPALLSEDPEAALAQLRPPPRYGSCVGPTLRDHVERMQTLGYKCDEKPYLRFDRFAQRRAGAEAEPLDGLIHAYAAESRSPAVHYEHVRIGRTLVRALQRADQRAPALPAFDRMLKQAVLRQRRRPYIYSRDEIGLLLRTAREFPSPHAPLRPLTLYTMFVLGYCVGLRMGEIAGLQLRDLRAEESALEIRETKFFKSRRLPIKPTVAAALGDYLEQRTRAGLPQGLDSPLFCHEAGGYAYITAEHLLRRVIRAAGLKPEAGRRGPRVHDLRHTFVVHRMLEWYRHGINPQSRLPYLSTYLGHRDIHATLVYLTITQELLGLASERFRAHGAALLAGPEGGHHAHDPVAPASAPGILPRLADPAARRLTPHDPCVSRQLATVPALRGRTSPSRGGRPRFR